METSVSKVKAYLVLHQKYSPKEIAESNKIWLFTMSVKHQMMNQIVTRLVKNKKNPALSQIQIGMFILKMKIKLHSTKADLKDHLIQESNYHSG